MKKQNIFILIFSILSLTKFYSQQIVDINTFERCFNDTCNANKYYKDINNKYDKFLGVWENTTGNLTFVVTVFKKEKVTYLSAENSYRDEIALKYKMIKDRGLITETIIYRSDKNYLNSSIPWPDVYSTISSGGIFFGSLIIDNCIPNNPKYPYLMGRLRFELNTSTNPVTAHWTVRKFSGIHLSGEPDFTIPKDIILTKQ